MMTITNPNRPSLLDIIQRAANNQPNNGESKFNALARYIDSEVRKYLATQEGLNDMLRDSSMMKVQLRHGVNRAVRDLLSGEFVYDHNGGATQGPRPTFSLPSWSGCPERLNQHSIARHLTDGVATTALLDKGDLQATLSQIPELAEFVANTAREFVNKHQSQVIPAAASR